MRPSTFEIKHKIVAPGLQCHVNMNSVMRFAKMCCLCRYIVSINLNWLLH